MRGGVGEGVWEGGGWGGEVGEREGGGGGAGRWNRGKRMR